MRTAALLLAVSILATSPAPARADALVAADGEDERTPLPVPAPTAKAVQYHRTGVWIWVFARCWDVAVPLAVVLTGASARLRDLARKVGRTWFGTVAVYLVLFLAVLYLTHLPLHYYAGFVRQHAYGL